MPFLGESNYEANFKKLARELEQVYSPGSSESCRESEETSRIRQYLPMWLEEVQLGCDLNMDTLKHYLLLQDEESRELGMEPHNRKLLIGCFDKLNSKSRATARKFCEAFDKVFGIASQDVILPAGLLKEMIEAARAAKKKPGPSANRISTYADLTCVICAAVDCPTHGDFAHERIDSSDVEDENEGKAPEMAYEPKALSLVYEDTIRRYRKRTRKDTEPLPLPEGRTNSCSDECYMAIDYSELDYEFDEEHLALLQQMVTTYKHPNYRSCYIAFALDIPCWTVYAEVQRYEGEGHEEESEDEGVSNLRAKKPDWYDNKKKTLRGDWNDSTSAHLHQERGQAIAVRYSPLSFRICFLTVSK